MGHCRGPAALVRKRQAAAARIWREGNHVRNGTILGVQPALACSDPNDAISELINTDRPDYFRDKYCLFDGMAGRFSCAYFNGAGPPGVERAAETKLVGARRSASCQFVRAELL